ncbi:bile acid:sodium symporter family protein [Bacteroidales bacterium OttesenSCG-928-C19]|nr:bile acid:sodium symporter family protein [Bacteroidales bacterium OttesenSCG-928-C19]
MYESLKQLDSVVLNFNQGSSLVVNIVLALIMFGVALDLRLNQFKDIIKNPKSLILGIFSQFFCLPAITFLLCIAFYKFIPPGVAFGMILVASCPGGNISNFMSSLAKANVALSIGLTSFSTFGALVFTPLNFSFWGRLYTNFLGNRSSELLQPLSIDPLQMFITVFIILGIPIALGLFFRYRFTRVSIRIKKPVKIISIILFFGIIIGALASNFYLFIEYIHWIFVIVLVHNAFAFLTGYSIAKIGRLSKADTKTLIIETGIQNSGLGLALLLNPKIFPQDAIGGMLMVAAWWGIWHIVSGLSIAFFLSKKKS